MRWGWVVRARGRGLAGEVVEEPVPPLKLLDGGGEVGHGPPVSQEPVHKAAREDATKVGCDHYKKRERERERPRCQSEATVGLGFGVHYLTSRELRDDLGELRLVVLADLADGAPAVVRADHHEARDPDELLVHPDLVVRGVQHVAAQAGRVQPLRNCVAPLSGNGS